MREEVETVRQDRDPRRGSRPQGAIAEEIVVTPRGKTSSAGPLEAASKKKKKTTGGREELDLLKTGGREASGGEKKCSRTLDAGGLLDRGQGILKGKDPGLSGGVCSTKKPRKKCLFCRGPGPLTKEWGGAWGVCGKKREST